MTCNQLILTSFSALALAAMLAGCAGSKSATSASVESPPAAAEPIVLDGSIDEWPADNACVADGSHVYVRFTLRDDFVNLQASPKTVAMLIDADGDPSTGRQGSDEATAGLGIDLEVLFSPPADEAGRPPRTGVAAYAYNARGERRSIGHDGAGLAFAPTYASVWYEARIARRAGADELRALADVGGTVRGVVATYDVLGVVDAWSDPFETVLPPLVESAAATIPAKPDGAIRVMSFNVLKSMPVKRPDGFARVFNAVSPDVVLLQEWDEGTATDVQAWFSTFVESGGGWHAAKPESGGCAILSRYPVTSAQIGEITAPDAEGEERPVRFASAIIATHEGAMFVGSTHLKCCGYAGSPEDVRREMEAAAINLVLDERRADLPDFRIIGGDINLVGSRPPLDILRASLDADGSDLAVAEARVLGDRALHTWSDPGNPFSPGRLDYLTYSDATLRVVNAFIVDARAIAASSDISDHLPIVVDFAAGGSGSAE